MCHRGATDEDDEQRVVRSNSSRRPPGACVLCKTLKIRCEFIPEEDTCIRCKAGDVECVSRGRKKRRPAPTQEELQQRSNSQDLHIQSLLRRLDETRTRCKLMHYLNEAEMEAASLGQNTYTAGTYASVRASGGRARELSSAYGMGPRAVRQTHATSLDEYGTSDPIANAPNSPAILQSRLFGPDEIAALFNIYFGKIHPSFAILDPDLHTSQYLMSKSPLLFTMILAIATRFWQHRPKLHRLAMAYASEAVSQALVDCDQPVETCQALILLTVFPAQFQRWCENRSWLLIGAAVRIAHQLQLDSPPPPELAERERLNRVRAWFFITLVDYSHCTQRGKTPAKPRNNFTDQLLDQWYRSSALNLPYDIYYAAYVDAMRLTSQLLDRIKHDKSNPDSWQEPDVLSLVREYDNRISGRFSHWKQRLTECIPMNWPERDVRLHMVTNMQRLIVLCAGVHWCITKEHRVPADILQSSVHVARAILRVHIEHLWPNGNLRYAIEPQYLHVTYAAAFLLKLLDPRYNALVDYALREDIVNNVDSLIRIWSSADVALDKQHTPFIYSRFLSSLLEHYTDREDISVRRLSRTHPATSQAWQAPCSAIPQCYDAGPSGYQTLFDADPSQFVQASHGGDAFAFQNFVSNVKTAQSGWPASSEPSHCVVSYDSPGLPRLWDAGNMAIRGNTTYDTTVLSNWF